MESLKKSITALSKRFMQNVKMSTVFGWMATLVAVAWFGRLIGVVPEVIFELVTTGGILVVLVIEYLYTKQVESAE